MQRRSSLGCVVSLVLLCCASATAFGANSANVAGLSQWDVSSFQINLLNHYGANGDVQSDQNGWVHLGANHLEGGDMTYNIQVGRLTPTDILEVWVDGYSSSNDLNVGPTLFIGAGKNRFEQMTRMSGDAWRPFVFRFADDRLYGDVTDPSNRNENWRIRYPSSKYEVRRIDKAPNELLDGSTLPVRISITGVDDFILKRLEVVVYRSQGSSNRNNRLSITNLAPYKVYQGNRVTVQFNQALPEKDVDFFLVDPSGRESRIYPQVTNSQRDAAWFYADGESFVRSGDYMVKVVDRSVWDQAQSDTERFEYLHPQARVVQKPRPKPTPDACALPPCPPLAFAPAPMMQPAQIMPVVPSAPFTQAPILIAPPTNQFETAPMAIVPVPNQQQMGGRAYTIQIAAVSSQQAALSLVNTLRAQGYDAYVSDAAQGQSRVYRVRVGSYPTKNHAAYDANRLQQSGFETWITTLS